jgi:hypothetical protein
VCGVWGFGFTVEFPEDDVMGDGDLEIDPLLW